MHTNFISCDWGTSSFRLRLIDAFANTVDEVTSQQGIAPTYQQWQTEPDSNRLSHYLAIIKENLQVLEQRNHISGLPVVISGMASSTIGMIELPYKPLPFNINGSDLTVESLQADDIPNRMVIVSGARTANDVMRGEETKVVGCAAGEGDIENAIFIFPGTHPKHVTIANNLVVDFKTYMTGEFFDLLSTRSILAVSVEKNADLQLGDSLTSFDKGVRDSFQHSLLHASFLVRTNEVFKTYTKSENYFYLSGLLIGYELKDLMQVKGKVVVAAGKVVSGQYLRALEVLGVAPIHNIAIKDADHCLIKGQMHVCAAYLR